MILRKCYTAGWLTLLSMSAAAAPGGPPVQTKGAAFPRPAWVEPHNHGANDPRLAGLTTPRGIAVELLPSADVPASTTIDQAIEWDGWRYHVLGGQLIRRRPHDPRLLQTLQAAAESRQGPPTSAAADGQHLEQSLLRGLPAFEAASVQLALGPDHWLYLSLPSGEHKLAGWDGAALATVRTGAVVRLQPTGTRLEEFARGLCRPGALAFDALGNAFCLDRGPADTTFAGARLLHVLPGADYGWLEARPAPGQERHQDQEPRPDALRAAADGSSAGALPPLLPGLAASPAELVLLVSPAFPDFLQVTALVIDSSRRAVRALTLERDGATFRVATEFDLWQAQDESLAPASLHVAADGCIHLATNAQPPGRFRLSWSGVGQTPAITPPEVQRGDRTARATDEELWPLVESPDDIQRQTAARHLIARALGDDKVKLDAQARVAAGLLNERLTVPARATMLFASGPLADKPIREALCPLLAHENLEFVRLAANALGQFPPADAEELSEIAEHVKGHYGRVSGACSERALQFALARLALAGVPDAAEWVFEATSVTHGPKMSRYVFDGHARALEMVPGAARVLMLGNLDVAINLDIVEPQERQRLKEFVTLTAEAMRTRELADFLDALFRGEDDLFVKLEAPLEARLIACYQNIHVHPPINADAVIEWLEKHPGGPEEVDVAALETLSIVGTTKREALDTLADRLLAQPAVNMTLAQRLLSGHVDRSFQQRIAAALKRHAAIDATGEAARLLAQIERLASAKP